MYQVKGTVIKRPLVIYWSSAGVRGRGLVGSLRDCGAKARRSGSELEARV